MKLSSRNRDGKLQRFVQIQALDLTSVLLRPLSFLHCSKLDNKSDKQLTVDRTSRPKNPSPPQLPHLPHPTHPPTMPTWVAAAQETGISPKNSAKKAPLQLQRILLLSPQLPNRRCPLPGILRTRSCRSRGPAEAVRETLFGRTRRRNGRGLRRRGRRRRS